MTDWERTEENLTVAVSFIAGFMFSLLGDAEVYQALMGGASLALLGFFFVLIARRKETEATNQ